MIRDTKIIVCYHKEADIFENDCLLPVHVGTELHPEVLQNMQGDNTGLNISNKNNTYNELTGLYWMWKNINAENYGLFHYRRFLDINNKYNNQEYPSNINLKDFDSTSFKTIMSKFDIIVPKKARFKISLYDHYKRSHIIKDLDSIIEIIKRDYPEYEASLQKAINSNGGYFSNMFIMKKEIFDEYCIWLFDILEKAEKIIDTTGYNPYQNRVIGFLSERMFSIFIQYKRDTNPNIKIKEVRRLFINDEPIKKINFIIGEYIEFVDKTCFNILGIKTTKKRSKQ